MALAKVLLGAIAISTVAIACSCEEPPTLCSRLQPNMVAFVGRPVSTVRFDRRRATTTFKVEERLWGLPQLDMISVEGADLSRAGRNTSWFVLAGRRTGKISGKDDVYFVNFECCPYGLLLPADDSKAREFRDNVAYSKPATMSVDIHSNWITLPDVKLQLRSSEYSWQGYTGQSTKLLELPPGEYTVGIEKTHFTLQEASRRATILPGSCTTWGIAADPNSSISGWIVDPRGYSNQRISYLLEGEVDPSLLDSPIDALRRSWHRVMGWGGPPSKHTFYLVNPAPDGRFQLAVLPGKYRLSASSGNSHDYVFPPPIPKTYYPGVVQVARATEIVVPDGGEFGNIQFQFPDFGPTRRIEVVLVTTKGSPASNRVVAHTGRYPSDKYRTAGWTQKLTDTRGRATFDVWQSLDYEFHVSDFVSGDSLQISAGSEPISRTFIVHR